MRCIPAKEIVAAVFEAIQYISYNPDPELHKFLVNALQYEQDELARDAIKAILENHKLSPANRIPLCQDTGTTIVFAQIGVGICLEEPLTESINKAVRDAQKSLPLRASMVQEPLFMRKNTNTNVPAFVHIESIPGDSLILEIAQKGGGAENTSFSVMLNPSSESDEIIDLICSKVIESGSKPCPPIVLGIGIGGNFELAPILAKKALFEKLGRANSIPEYAHMEKQIVERINNQGCGVQGLGGKITVIAAHIKSAPCHIASLPLAVNMQCHVHRHTRVEL